MIDFCSSIREQSYIICKKANTIGGSYSNWIKLFLRNKCHMCTYDTNPEAELPGTGGWTGRNGKCRYMEDCVQHMA